MSTSSSIELADDSADISFDVSEPMELVIYWTKVHGPGKTEVQLRKTDSVCLWYRTSARVVEINKHLIEVHIKRAGVEDLYVFVESFHKPVLYYSGTQETI